MNLAQGEIYWVAFPPSDGLSPLTPGGIVPWTPHKGQKKKVQGVNPSPGRDENQGG
jgi:hypothetical protein